MTYSKSKEKKAFEEWWDKYWGTLIDVADKAPPSLKIVAKASWRAGVDWCDEQERI